MEYIRAITSFIVLAYLSGVSILAFVPAGLVEVPIQEIDNQFIVIMETQANLIPARDFVSKADKGQWVYNALTVTAERTQKDIRCWLDNNRICYKSYWIQNMILVYGDVSIRQELAMRSDVAMVVSNRHFQAIDPAERRMACEANAARGVEWNLHQIRADDVWNEFNVKGCNIIICDNDTGVDWDHPALIDQYRGWDGAIADHNYNWFDATGTSTSEPIDDHGHGTHTTGTIVGYDGGENQIGVAPEASWIGTKCMDADGGGTDEWFHDAFQWILAPTDTNDENPDPLKAPHVVNNSWGYAGGNDPVIEADILALVSAGIFIEVSSGNEGPGCQTLRSPADYENTFTTGASISGGLLAGFSSRGPSQLYPAITKPEVVAPGQNIRSSVPGGGYEGGWSGTSMAGPHTVGLVALIWSANPNLIGDLDTTRQLIQDTAVFSDVNECAGESRGIPNNVYGWGEIDCYAVVQEVYPPESAGMLMLSRAAYNCSDTISIVVKDSDIAGTGTLDVLATSTTETGTPETVVLSEDDAGVFRGTITTATGSPTPDGILQITENDQITIEYIDVDHGGTGPLTITRTAVVDCTAPVASNIIIDTLTSISAEISWDTNENSTTGILFGETTPLGDKIVMGRYNIEHSVVLGGLLECTDYLYAIEVMDEAGNMFIDDNAGQYYTFKTWRNIRAMDEPLNSDPEWETQGNWEFGVPQGNDGDPTSGTTGSNVYGYNLAGAYENNMPKYSLISPSYDLTTATRTTIGYSLWVGVGAYPDDQLGWDVSLDGGTTWIPLFDNSYFSGSMQMDFWIPIEVPLGDLIDGQADVSFRWTMGPTDDSEVFGGWNIDDIWMSYDTDCDLPTPTPAPTATPTFPLGVRIDVPEMAHPGEMFHVTGYLDNPDPVLSSVPVFFILDVYGEMWFWPGWKHFSPPDFVDIDYRIMDIPTGSSEVIVLAEFAWPDTGSGNISGLFFYGAMLNQQMSGLLGEMAAEQWGYSPG